MVGRGVQLGKGVGVAIGVRVGLGVEDGLGADVALARSVGVMEATGLAVAAIAPGVGVTLGRIASWVLCSGCRLAQLKRETMIRPSPITIG